MRVADVEDTSDGERSENINPNAKDLSFVSADAEGKRSMKRPKLENGKWYWVRVKDILNLECEPGQYDSKLKTFMIRGIRYANSTVKVLSTIDDPPHDVERTYSIDSSDSYSAPR